MPFSLSGRNAFVGVSYEYLSREDNMYNDIAPELVMRGCS